MSVNHKIIKVWPEVNIEITMSTHRSPTHSELIVTTAWLARRDDLVNSSPQADDVSCKLTESSQCEFTVS